MKTTVIIPAYNEGQSIGNIVDKLIEMYPGFEVLVIDDGSTDDTALHAKNAGARVYRHPYNIGNGAAVKSGIRVAHGDILVFMDADGQHRPEDVATMLAHFPDYDMVIGARSGSKRGLRIRSIGNTLLNRLASYVAKQPVRDLTSGFRAVKSTLARQFLYLLPNTYSYPTTLTLSVMRSGRTVKYIPITTTQRVTGKSNIRVMKDGIRFFMIVVKVCTMFSSFRVFLPVSFATFMVGLIYYLYTYFRWGRFTNMSALLFTTSVIIFMMGLVSDQVCQMRFENSEEINPTDLD